MIEWIKGASPRLRARIAGVLYLVIFIAAPSGADSATLGKMAITLTCDTGVALLFYGLFKPVSRNLSLLGAAFRLIFVAAMTVNSLNYFGLVNLFNGARSPSAFDAGYDIALVPFGVHCVVTGYLIFRSRFLPRTIGILVALAGLGYLTFLWPPLGNRLFIPYILVPALLGEGSLTLWLMLMGVKAERWTQGHLVPGLAAAGAIQDICDLSLREVTKMLRTRQLSAREVMAAQLDRIRRWNPRLNAIVAKLDDDACLALADAADDRAARGDALGALHGVPWAFKDLEAAIGFPWTRGSPIYRDDRPAVDSILVERLRLAGVIPIGKTNTPEFGMGSQTYNSVYGTTLNPYDRTKTSGGSSGGAAAGVAVGMLSAADGSDLAGSLRNPASFNNVVGFRPTVGLVPIAPSALPFFGFAVKGPIARSVSDVGYLLAAIAGPDSRDPGCMPSDPSIFAGNLDRSFKDVRVAWCPDLGGLPLDHRVRDVLFAQRRIFEGLGCIVEDRHPDLEAADEIFLTLRAFRSWTTWGPLLPSHRSEMKPEAIKEIEDGGRLTAPQVSAAMVHHGQLLDRIRVFQETYPFILSTVSQVPPFDATVHWPSAIEGVPMEHYIAWMKSAYWISTTFHPSIAVPAGFTPDGLPVGLQIVGRHRDDLGVLQLANAFEQATGVGKRRPPDT
jgi:amidase